MVDHGRAYAQPSADHARHRQCEQADAVKQCLPSCATPTSVSVATNLLPILTVATTPMRAAATTTATDPKPTAAV